MLSGIEPDGGKGKLANGCLGVVQIEIGAKFPSVQEKLENAEVRSAHEHRH